MEETQGARVREVRVAGAQDGDIGTADFDALGDVDGGGARLLHARRVARVRQEGDVPRLRVVEAGGARNLHLREPFTFEARVRQRGKFCEFHTLSLSHTGSSNFKVCVISEARPAGKLTNFRCWGKLPPSAINASLSTNNSTRFVR
jgi:hypothetical protein